MTWILPAGVREAYAALERFGILLVLVVIYFVPPVQHALWNAVDTMGVWVNFIVTLGGAW